MPGNLSDKVSNTPQIAIAFLLFVGSVFAFSAGVDTARDYKATDKYRYVIQTSSEVDLKEKLVRSGERGVMFYEQKSRLLFLLPWSEVKKITSDQGPAS